MAIKRPSPTTTKPSSTPAAGPLDTHQPSSQPLHPWRQSSPGQKPANTEESIVFRNDHNKYILELRQRHNKHKPDCMRCNFTPGVIEFCPKCYRERKLVDGNGNGNDAVEHMSMPWHNGPRSDGTRLARALKALYKEAV